MYQNHPSIRVNNDDEGYVFYSLEPSILCLLFVIITQVKLVLCRGYFGRTAGSSVPIPYSSRDHSQKSHRTGCKNGYEHALCAEVRIKYGCQAFSSPEPVVSWSGKRGALEASVTGYPKISDIRSRMCRSYKYHCSCS